MARYKALLIQDLTQLFELLEPYVNQALDACIYDGVEYESAWKWIIEEQLELIYGLFGKNHDRYHYPHAMVHDLVSNITPVPLSRYISAHIGVPEIDYDHNVVDLEIMGRNLFIYYVPLNLPISRNFSVRRIGHEPTNNSPLSGS